METAYQTPTSVPSVATKPAPTLHQVLRAQSLGELQNKEISELRAYKAILKEKVAEIQNRIATTNLYIMQVSDLQSDIRWYILIETEIDALLTAEFHAKAA